MYTVYVSEQCIIMMIDVVGM